MDTELKIDFVIPWVDGTDRDWQEKKAKYMPDSDVDANINRYRDWGTLKYWFRSVEKFAPWVNQIYLICDNRLPDWLNQDFEKLTVLRHEDYIPGKYLPTFQANPIELNIHRIEGLSEHFVYLNDDIFFLKKLEKTDFFRNGNPVDDAILSPIIMEGLESMGGMCANNMRIINEHFNKKDVMKTKSKWYSLKYGKNLFRTICLTPWHHLPGFFNDHLAQPYLKETFKKVWELEGEILDEVCAHKFRSYRLDVNHWLMRYWQFCEEKFVPASPKRGRCFLGVSDELVDAIKKQKYSTVCINDDNNCDFEADKKKLIEAFDSILPDKSNFEK